MNLHRHGYSRPKAGAALAACVLLAAPVARAQQQAPYPNKSIRLIVASAPSGGVDTTARLLGQKLTDALGKSVVVDNRPGAAGDIGMDLAAKANPDGYTLTMVSVNHAVNPSFIPRQPYNLLRDLAPITRTSLQAYLLVVNNSVPAKSVSELVALGKSRPEGLRYASGGTGALTHLAGAMLGLMTGARLTHVPYKGGGPALIGLMAGDAHLQFSDAVGAGPHVRAGRVRGVGVTSAKRQVAFPDIPTLAEAGVPGYEVTSWYGMLAPAKTPPAIVSRLNQEVLRILAAPDVVEKFVGMGAEASGTTPAQFSAFMQAEIAKWKRVVEQAGIRAE